MPIAKRQIVDMLLDRRDHDRAIRADEELPGLVYVELHSGLLADLGLDPADLLCELGDTPPRFDRRRRSPASRRSLAGGLERGHPSEARTALQ